MRDSDHLSKMSENNLVEKFVERYMENCSFLA